jgi:hypothetical protein
MFIRPRCDRQRASAAARRFSTARSDCVTRPRHVFAESVYKFHRDTRVHSAVWGSSGVQTSGRPGKPPARANRGALLWPAFTPGHLCRSSTFAASPLTAEIERRFRATYAKRSAAAPPICQTASDQIQGATRLSPLRARPPEQLNSSNEKGSRYDHQETGFRFASPRT